MQKARNGKIARLPRHIREELNRRMEDGQTEGVILPWLNALPEVQAVLAGQFGSSLVSQQNLSKWRMGGYQNWLQQQEHSQLVREVASDAKEFNEGHETQGLAANLSTIVLAEMVVAIRAGQKAPSDPTTEFKRSLKMVQAVSKVRRDEYREGRLALDRDILEFDARKAATGKQSKTK